MHSRELVGAQTSLATDSCLCGALLEWQQVTGYRQSDLQDVSLASGQNTVLLRSKALRTFFPVLFIH